MGQCGVHLVVRQNGAYVVVLPHELGRYGTVECIPHIACRWVACTAAYIRHCVVMIEGEMNEITI